MRATGFVASALALVLACGAAFAQQPKAPAPGLGLTEIPEPELNGYIAKSNAVVGLLNTSQRAQDSINRYASWVNVKTGPTGKERVIYGLYSVGVSSTQSAVNKARQAIFDKPAIPPLDTAVQELAEAFEKLVPILNEAEAYYDRKDYLDDGMRGGKELHGKIVPASRAFLAARQKAEVLQTELKDLIDVAQLARIEKTEGKSVRWHSVHTMRLAKKAVDLMPNSPKAGANELKEFDTVMAEYGKAVREFDDAVRESGKSPSNASYPRDILGRLREMRDAIGKGRMDNMTFSMSRHGIVTAYNMMVTMSNTFR